jgi:hypothetical protein
MEDTNQIRKCILLNTPKARVGQVSRWREWLLVEEVGQRSEAGPAGLDPKREFKGKIDLWISMTFEILARLQEFLQADLEGIWTQGLFLSSSRILKDF